MAEDNFITHPVKVKVVADIGNISLADSETGELVFDSSASNTLNIRLVDAWYATTGFS